MQDRPTSFPTTQPDGEPLKPLTRVMLERRATAHFTDEEVPEEYLNAILALGCQAPSGYNLQPWRFIVVREASNRRRLQQVAFNQAKVTEAPVVIIALGMKEEWKERAGEVFREGARETEDWQRARDRAVKAVSGVPAGTWVNRHTMIALTTMMLVAEAYGFDTAPMEGFDAAGVRAAFDVPEEAEVCALLAIGRAAPPDKPYLGRFELDRLVYHERYKNSPKSEGPAA
ncbi:MAG TPA: nitroreductase family protein [Pyrinomonadaceae bacterium]